ncbi:MAG TPA: hypothetical protein P5317_07750 [Myxococcota bacterium]|nr:hypothetical protein [Myxococcota bacterium]HRV17888.1 hypothetical protein [Myxococcota bacterium]
MRVTFHNKSVSAFAVGAAIHYEADKVYYASFAGAQAQCSGVWAAMVGSNSTFRCNWHRHGNQALTGAGNMKRHYVQLPNSRMWHMVVCYTPKNLLLECNTEFIANTSDEERQIAREAALPNLYRQLVYFINDTTKAVVDEKWGAGLYAGLLKYKAITELRTYGDCVAAALVRQVDWKTALPKLIEDGFVGG